VVLWDPCRPWDPCRQLALSVLAVPLVRERPLALSVLSVHLIQPRLMLYLLCPMVLVVLVAR
jgi:hypothetical protein